MAELKKLPIGIEDFEKEIRFLQIKLLQEEEKAQSRDLLAFSIPLCKVAYTFRLVPLIVSFQPFANLKTKLQYNI